MGSEVKQHVEKIKTSAEFEQKSQENRKLNKHIARKLIHAHTKRLLKILGHSQNEHDRRRLEYAISNYDYTSSHFSQNQLIGHNYEDVFGNITNLKEQLQELKFVAPEIQ